MARCVVSTINSEPHLCQRASHIESVSWLIVMRGNCRISVFALLLGTSLAQTLPIDAEHSVITVHVFKSGLFSGFADNHEIRAPISSGLLDQAAGRVEIVVDSRKLVVLDPNLPPAKRQQVQERMLGPEVLDSNQFHEIRFQANDVKEESADHFLLAGTLSLHGKTRPISLHVVRSSGHYRGDVMLKQRDFGITPVTVAGGTVKVKDELKIELDISAEAIPKQAENNR
jgi:polyisoprenoid-binding protein YceI